MKEGRTLEEWLARVQVNLRRAAKGCAKNAQQWAYDNRVWTDHHGLVPGEGARGNLKGGVIDDGENIGFYVAQGVKYGAHLETVAGGKYGICKQAVEAFVPKFDKAIRKSAEKWQPDGDDP